MIKAKAKVGEQCARLTASGLLARYSANVPPSTAQGAGIKPEREIPRLSQGISNPGSPPDIVGQSKMQLILNVSKFEEHQAIFISEIVEKIKIKLQEAGVGPEQLEDLTASIALSVASTIDDTAGIDVDGVEVHPYLTFRAADDSIIHCGENSYTYEFVYGAMKKLFRP